ncbi:hypothetical protein IMG5_030080 [Ichthyophthirius multifiliis]|uniref:Uncharacterized protein n=1 Tax=Ichthyophthirius multifiliis TaxID=5932 RepID=G0QLG3_ICHMU|nr:hypothetical protein IMG5_030080 [Ichthyophthirius multifiliis]EGR33944.1 hypothetical protein IMG5_030080 [Ichthyophthirius multifiliis]|eukprot:XP_004039248.1 hypothetical protein IMG5_030080 [Ichthyophthirius multifiliis]
MYLNLPKLLNNQPKLNQIKTKALQEEKETQNYPNFLKKSKTIQTEIKNQKAILKKNLNRKKNRKQNKNIFIQKQKNNFYHNNQQRTRRSPKLEINLGIIRKSTLSSCSLLQICKNRRKLCIEQSHYQIRINRQTYQ